jgi:hypothetical protein
MYHNQDDNNGWVVEPITDNNWVKFKPNDKSTWPTEHLPLLVLNRAKLISIDVFNPPHWASNFHYDNITHWQPLPPLPEQAV